MAELWYAVRRLISAKWEEITHYDLMGDLQMETRAAKQDVMDAWYLLRAKKVGRSG